MISRDNCIPFDDIASVYDQTRFLPQNAHFKTFDEIIKTIAMLDLKEGQTEVSFLEAGCGSGRLILPFIEQLCLYLNGEQAEPLPPTKKAYWPFDLQPWAREVKKKKYEGKRDLGIFKGCNTLNFYCLDISSEMLNRFKNKLKNNGWSLGGEEDDCFVRAIKNGKSSWNIRVYVKEGDLRTYRPTANSSIRFDVVFAHWIFHVIKDWHLALLNIYDLSKDNALLFTFSEHSQLYDAIDNKFTEIAKDTKTRRFWEDYFDSRAKIYAYYGVSIPPAKQRIGANVNDININHWVNKLYDPLEIGKEDEWGCRYSNREIIKNIIEERAFSNMRLGKDETFKEIYKEIAKSLKPNSEDNKKKHFYSTTKFQAHCYKRKRLNNDQKLSILKKVTKEVLSKKMPNDLFSIPHRAYLKYIEELGKTDKEDSKLIGIHFFNPKQVETNFREIIRESFFPSEELEAEELTEIWKNLTNYSDLENSYYGIRFVKEQSQIKEEEKDKEALDVLLTISKGKADLMCGFANDSDLTFSRIEIEFKSIYESILEKKICDSYEDHIVNFFSSISKLYKRNDITANCYYYFFPNLVYTPTGHRKSFGFMLWSKNKLTSKSKIIQNIKELNDMIFGNIAQDFQTDFSVNVPVVVTSHNNTRIFGKLNKKKEDACDILIVTCTSSEFEQAIKLAGVPKNKKEKRKIEWASYGDKKLPMIYDISQESFRDKKVWVFQTFETGDGAYGISYSLGKILEHMKNNSMSLPKLVIMGGIAAGLKEDDGQIRGQILLASSVQKVTIENPDTQEGTLQKVDEVIINTVKECGKKYIDNTKSKTLYSQKIHLGPIISVDEVVNNYFLRSTIKEKNGDALGLEMEGHGLAMVCNDEKNKIKWLLIKGISDFAHRKDEIEDYQKNIAKNTFDFIYYCLENEKFNSLIEQLGSE
ncbi:hypothetical protein [Porphyromonas gingivalis]